MNYSNDDYVRNIHGKTLTEALIYVSKKQVSITCVPVNVFRDVLSEKQMNISISEYIQSDKHIKVNAENLTIVKNGVYELISDNRTSVANRRNLCEEENSFIKRKKNENDESFAKRSFQKVCCSSENESFISLYGRDSSVAPNKQILLEVTSSPIHPSNGVPIMEGVNKSMWYIGGPGSVTTFHVEDGDFASMNILISGEEKIWGFIFEKDFNKLRTNVRTYLAMEKDCTIFHKPGLLIGPELLEKWKIDVKYIIQRPGDLVFIGEAVIHFVVNVGVNIAEAINYCTRTAASQSDKTFCKCPDVGRSNREYFTSKCINKKKWKVSNKKIYDCRIENCNESFLYKKTYDAHVSSVHKAFLYKCKDCERQYKSNDAYKKHYKNCHLNKRDIKERCFINNCKKIIKKKYMKSHVEKHHGNKTKGECDKCFRVFLKKNLASHLNRCTGIITCSRCQKILKSKQALSQHKCNVLPNQVS